MTARLVGLADNAAIPYDVLEAMLALRPLLAALVEDRERTIDELGLDREFCLPDAHWGEESTNRFRIEFAHVLYGDTSVFNRLRVSSGMFTGYNVRTMGDRDCGDVPAADAHVADLDRWLHENHSEPDKWVAGWKESTRGLPGRYVYSPPRMMGELGWEVNGVVVNHDTYVYQERINLMYAGGVLSWLESLRRPPRILEIGGGYGGLCSALRAIFPECLYVICDLPECLMFSGLYLTAASGGQAPKIFSRVSPGLPDQGACLIPNYLFHHMNDTSSRFDLVVNTLSMSEMSSHQIRTYCTGISALIGDSGMFFEQNQDNTSVGMLDCKPIIASVLPHRFQLARVHEVVTIGSLVVAATQGTADLWANVPLAVGTGG